MPTPMTDASINRALFALRAQIIRDDMDGLHHVEALIQARGYDPERQHVPRKRAENRFRRSELRRLIQDALRGGPQTLAALANYVAAQRPVISPQVAYRRVSSVLSRMKAAGLVVHEGRMWGLAHTAKPLKRIPKNR